MLRSCIIPFIVLVPSALANAAEKPNLIVYTYDSFVSEWGPGPTIKPLFESECKCTLNFVPVADGAALLARLQVEKSSSKADVVVGIDETLTAMAESFHLFEDTGIKISNSILPSGFTPSTKFVPFDFGYYSFIFDTKAKTKTGKPYPRPRSMDELLTLPELEKSIIIEDPRTSAPGLGLLLWLNARYGEKTPDKLVALKKQVLTTSRGWSEAYNLFTKGEAPIVFSYSTSEAYHRQMDKTDRYNALIFSDGHYAAIETAAILNTSKNKNLAKEFIKFLLRIPTQAIIASKNWMYPVTFVGSGLPPAYAIIATPERTFRLSPEVIQKQRKQWIQEWQKAFSK